ncbi:hypothetical protein V497_03700, partial [Pseudogymnoascus sp. VKM F-4516 (FW-969)]
MTSPSSTASSPIPGDAYFADLYSLHSHGASPVHSRSPSPICSPPAPASQKPKPSRDHHNHTHNKHNPSPKLHAPPATHTPQQSHRPPPYRPRLDFTSPPTAPYRPSLSFLPSGGTSPASVSASTSASPLTPESPVGGSGGEKYAFPVDEEKYIKQEKDSRVSAQ